MSTRPLRQYYGAPDGTGVRIEVDATLWPVTRPWTAQRERMLNVLRDLPTAAWDRPTRCDAWSVKDVIGHLVVVDQFWSLTLGNGLAAAEPTRFLAGFDPSSSTDDLVAATVAQPVAQLLEQFATGTATFAGVVGQFTDATWPNRAESPMGHLPAHQLLAHAIWDSWLHERDILVPTGDTADPAPDELRAAAAWNCVFAALQGGLVGDPDAVAAGPAAPIRVALRFADLPGTALALTVDDGVTLEPANPADAVDAGTAIDFVEGLTGRAPIDRTLMALPTDFAAQVARAAQTL